MTELLSGIRAYLAAALFALAFKLDPDGLTEAFIEFERANSLHRRKR